MAFSATDAARAIIAAMKEGFCASPTMVLAEASEFVHLDLPAYARFQADMEALGFRTLGDIEILEISHSPTTVIARTFIRTMLSTDGSIGLHYYQLKPRFWRAFRVLLRGLLNLRLYDGPQNFFENMITRHYFDVETEFMDGSQLTTSNLQAATTLTGPPSIERQYFPYDTRACDLLDRHAERVSQLAAGDPPSQPLKMGSLEDLFQMQTRQSMLKAAHRASVQWITESELRDLSGGQDTSSEMVYAEVQRLLRAEQTNR